MPAPPPGAAASGGTPADRLRRALDAALSPLLAGEPAAALAIFPNHWNVGDSAIWLGQLATLERLGVRTAYVCDARTYARDDLARALPEGPILLSGGGNFGDVYPHEQGLRERILDDFPDRRIVQLPQSVWFRSGAARDALYRRCGSHRRFVFIARDQVSFDDARERLAADVHLAPDMAFGLPDLRARRAAPTLEVLWLLRRDSEASDRAARREAVRRHGAAVRDWTRPGADVARATWAACARAFWLSWRLSRRAGRPPGGGGARTAREFATLAGLRLAYGLRLLSAGKVVVTDRLHGAILARLLDIPHVSLDSSNGKVRGYFERWGAGADLARWAASPPEAEAAARALLAARPGPA